jgi:hypothetical protein
VRWHSREVAISLLRKMLRKMKPKVNEHERDVYCILLQALHGLKFTTPWDSCVTVSAVGQSVGVFVFPPYGIYSLYKEISSVPTLSIGKNWYAELLKLKQLPLTAIDGQEAFNEVMAGVARHDNVLFRIGCIDLLKKIALNAKYAHHDITADLTREKLEEWQKHVGCCGRVWSTGSYLVQDRLERALTEIKAFKLKGVVRAVKAVVKMKNLISGFKLNNSKLKGAMNDLSAPMSSSRLSTTRREKVNQELLEKETKQRTEERAMKDRVLAEFRSVPNELWDRAVAAEEKDDLQTAAALFKQLADSDNGHVDAQNKVGFMYEKGLGGLTQSFEYACQYYRHAAIKGLPEAQYNLGVCYSRGRGTEQDFVRARAWFHFAADGGDRRGLHNLGVLYFNGMGMPRVALGRAHECFKKAFELGYEASEASLEMVNSAISERNLAASSGALPGQPGNVKVGEDMVYTSAEEILREWEEEGRMASNESAFIDQILTNRSTARASFSGTRFGLDTLEEGEDEDYSNNVSEYASDSAEPEPRAEVEPEPPVQSTTVNDDSSDKNSVQMEDEESGLEVVSDVDTA